MWVRVLVFGVLKELLGLAQRDVELPEGASAGDVIAELEAGTSKQSEVWSRLAVAVNREYASRSVLLHEGDEVALLPPVSGGSGGPMGEERCE